MEKNYLISTIEIHGKFKFGTEDTYNYFIEAIDRDGDNIYLTNYKLTINDDCIGSNQVNNVKLIYLSGSSSQSVAYGVSVSSTFTSYISYIVFYTSGSTTYNAYT